MESVSSASSPLAPSYKALQKRKPKCTVLWAVLAVGRQSCPDCCVQAREELPIGRTSSVWTSETAVPLRDAVAVMLRDEEQSPGYLFTTLHAVLLPARSKAMAWTAR